MTVAIPPVIAEGFAINGDRNIIPVPSQIGTTPGAASFNDGFPPLTATSPSAGGIPPAYKDWQGILYMISAHCAWLQGGGAYKYSSAFITVAGGYHAGAILQSASIPATFYLNTVDGNENDPDSVITGWIKYSPISGAIGRQTYTMPTGTTSDFALNLGVGFLDLDPTTGAANLTGIAPANVTDGQLLVITNLNSSNSVTVKAFDVSSAANARFRMPADFTLVQYNPLTVRYSSAVGMWVLT